jgi:hypothetical protein
MHHNKLAKRAKQTDDQRLARHKQIKELAKYVSKEFSASGTKLGVEEENYHTAAEYGSDEDDGMDLSTGSNVNFEENDVNSEDSNKGKYWYFPFLIGKILILTGKIQPYLPCLVGKYSISDRESTIYQGNTPPHCESTTVRTVLVIHGKENTTTLLVSPFLLLNSS